MELPQIFAAWPALGSHMTTLDGMGRALHLVVGAEHYFLKRRPSAEHALRELVVLERLRGKGLPVPEHVRRAGGEVGAPGGLGAREVWCLYRALPGDHYDSFDGKVGLAQARRVGKALGELHVALADVSDTGGFDRYGPEAQLIDELAAAQDLYDVARARRIAARITSTAGLPQQLIHRDFHLYNLLFSGDQVSGYLDFDMLMRGPRLFDLCYCSIETLAKRFDEPAFPDYWFRVLGAIFKGYTERVALTELEKKSVVSVMMEIELLFMHHFRAEPIPGRNAERVLHWLDARRQLIQAIVLSV